MKWIIHLRTEYAEILYSDPIDINEAVETVEILMKPSMFGNKELYNITLEPVKER